MKKILLISLFALLGCDRRVSQDIEANHRGQVTINGKNCEIVSINVGDLPRVLFVDCGVGSSSTTTQQGKVQQSVGQYMPPASTPPVITAEPTCICASPTEEMKKLKEVKKEFYK